MKKLVLLLAIVILSSAHLSAQVNEDCLCMPEGETDSTGGWGSHYDLKIDTCGIVAVADSCDGIFEEMTGNAFDSIRHNRIYAVKKWIIDMEEEIIEFPDSIDYATWDNVSVEYPEVKDSLKNIEQNFGTYKIYDENSEVFPNLVFVVFDNYVKAYTVEKAFNNIPLLTCIYEHGVYSPVSSIKDIKKNNLEYIESVSYDGIIKVKFNKIEGYVDLNVYNNMGVLIFSNTFFPDSREIKINLHNMNSGIYFVQINNKFHKILILR